MNPKDFTTLCRERGYPEPSAYPLDSSALDPEMHTHEISAMIMITEGEFELETSSGKQILCAGDHVEVPAGTRHAETNCSAGKVLISIRQS